jgi:hypothetical protein
MHGDKVSTGKLLELFPDATNIGEAIIRLNGRPECTAGLENQMGGQGRAVA